MTAFSVQTGQHGVRLMRAADSCRSWRAGRLTYERASQSQQPTRRTATQALSLQLHSERRLHQARQLPHR
jgi:hypothetical protein